MAKFFSLQHIAKVPAVLVSTSSRRRAWLSFEAGFGYGKNAEVIPISIRGFSLGKLDFPLAGFQGRMIDGLPSILADITRRLDQPSERQDLDVYLSKLREAEMKMAYKSLEVFVPSQYVNLHWPAGASDFQHFEKKRRANEEYWWFACTSQRGVFGRKQASLRPIVTPTMGTVIAHEMSIPIAQRDLPYTEQRLSIHYHVHAVDHPTEMETITWAALEYRT